jgi:hypothetical protein
MALDTTTKWFLGGLAAVGAYFLFIHKPAAAASSKVAPPPGKPANVDLIVPALTGQTLTANVSVGQTLTIHAPVSVSYSYGDGVVGDPTSSPDGMTLVFPVTGSKVSASGSDVALDDGHGGTANIKIVVS